MNAADFTFEGLDAITGRLRQAADQAAYLVVQDRTDRSKAETLGRLDLTPDATAPYRPGNEAPAPPEAMAAAGAAWVAEVARRNTVGEPWRRFRVKVFGPKGLRLVDSGQFVCRNAGFDLEEAGGPHRAVRRVVQVLRQSTDRLDHLVAEMLEERLG